MQKKYAVNKKLRKTFVAEMYKLQKPKMIIQIFFYVIFTILSALVFIIPTIYLLPMLIEVFLEGYLEDAGAIFILIVFSFCCSLISWLVPCAIKHFSEKKYMWKWLGRTEEYVFLQSKSVKWSHYDRFMGKSYWEHQIQYTDIQRLEYNIRENTLYVYGYMSGKEWTSVNREHCIDTIEIDRKTDEICWMTLPAYFEDFEELKRNLSELSGQQIIKV